MTSSKIAASHLGASPLPCAKCTTSSSRTRPCARTEASARASRSNVPSSISIPCAGWSVESLQHSGCGGGLSIADAPPPTHPRLDVASSNWKAAGRIPPRWYLRLAPEAHRLNVPLDAGVFGEDGRAA